MNSALWKDNLREIKDSIPRFISIFAIIALGVSFFVGIRAAGPSMVKTAREVYQDNNMPDGHILSTVGLNEASPLALSPMISPSASNLFESTFIYRKLTL